MLLEEFTPVLVITIILLYFGLPWAYGWWNRLALRQQAVKHTHLVLTFDDGPGRELTRAVLQLLAQHGIKATFFLRGRNVQEHPDLVREIQAQGHEIGSHTYDHLHAWKVAPWRSIADIRRGFQAIDEALGTHAGRYSFRPPYGKLNLATLLYLLVRRVPIVYWTVDSGDTWFVRPDQSTAAHLSKVVGGGVVLAHDFDRSQGPEVHQYVLDALRSILDMAQEHGMRFSTAAQLRRIPQ
jgi:peptidoglycan/xylan/chitin deacetylase (PgdA/CDA1 family)